MSKRYSLEVGKQFVYIRDGEKRIATVYGNKSEKQERGFNMVQALNDQNEAKEA